MDISVIIPSYNEAENLRLLLPSLHSVMSEACSEYELLVVDSEKTTDDTEKVCEELSAEYIVQTGTGYAGAFRTGIKKAVGDAVLVVDADNSQDISKIGKMYEAFRDGCDVVIGSRYAGGTTRDPLMSVLMSKALNFAYRVVLGFNEKDISTDFRIYRRSLLEQIQTKCENFDVIEETLYLLKKNNPLLRVREIPIDYRQRAYGNSKRQTCRFVCDYMKLLVKLRFGNK